MPPPTIISLWRRPGGTASTDNFLCGGLRLDERHVLTVRHAFDRWPDEQPVYVRLIDGVDGDAEARVWQCHPALDAALLALDHPAPLAQRPDLETRAGAARDAQGVVLHAIDPDSHGRVSLSSYGIGGTAQDTGEYILAPDNARGHSGGVVVVNGQVIGLLSRRAVDDPICRAIPIYSLWPWLAPRLPAAPLPASDPPRLVAGASAAYRALVEKVRERIRARLICPGLEPLVARWHADPLSGFDFTDPIAHLQGVLDDLRHATKGSGADWRRQPAADALHHARAHCRWLVTELIKLMVDPTADSVAPDDLDGPTDNRDPRRLHLRCGYAGTADTVYFSCLDLEHLLALEPEDIASAHAVRVRDEIAANWGEQERADLLRQVWLRVMPDEPLPASIDDKAEKRLKARIDRHRGRRHERTHYLLNAPGSARGLEHTNWRLVADQLGLGLVLHEDGSCAYLLLDEDALIDTVREYLQTLESL